MSELKSVYIDRTGDWCRSGNDTGKFYLKSEVDKVIAEKDKELRRQKYRRCLAMAMWCEEVDLFGGYTSNYWMRWRNKWLELAEKFKPNSTAK